MVYFNKIYYGINFHLSTRIARLIFRFLPYDLFDFFLEIGNFAGI